MGKTFFNDKTKKKIKEKRFYIVLACCVLAISAIAFTNSMKQKQNLAAENKNSNVKYSLPEPIKENEDENKTTPILIKEHSAPDIPFTEPEEDITEDTKPEKETDLKDADSNALAQISHPTGGKILLAYTNKPMYFDITGDWRTHEAIDYLVAEGDMVYSAARGKIIDITDSGLYGASITIDHENSMKTVYSNVVADGISVGDYVEAGDVIGLAQSTSLSEKYDTCHIHFEVMIDNKNVNPADWLK